MAGPATAYVKEWKGAVRDGALNLVFSSQLDSAKVAAIEVIPAVEPNHLLHAEIQAPQWVVDYSGTGTAPVPLVGSASHTHELGQKLFRFQWREGGRILSEEKDFVASLAQGGHQVTLQVWDGKVPAGTAEASVDVEVVGAQVVPGVLVSYYSPDVLPAALGAPLYREILPAFSLDTSAGCLGGSPFSSASVVFEADWVTRVSGTYAPRASGTVSGTFSLDGMPWSGLRFIAAGKHRVSWTLPALQASTLPLEFRWVAADGTSGPLSSLGTIVHDESSMLPQINRMPASGPALGGDLVEIFGLGFFPRSGLSVQWGNRRVDAEIMEVTPERIRLVTPPGIGAVSVRVVTRQGVSNPVSYQYKTGVAPVQFVSKGIFTISAPTQAAWGPDGRLYVASLSGSVTALELDDQYNVLRSEILPAVQAQPNRYALGIGFSPWEPPSAFNIYLAHSKLFVTSGMACAQRLTGGR